MDHMSDGFWTLEIFSYGIAAWHVGVNITLNSDDFSEVPEAWFLLTPIIKEFWFEIKFISVGGIGIGH